MNRDVPRPSADLPSPRSLNIHFDLTAHFIFTSSKSASTAPRRSQRKKQTKREAETEIETTNNTGPQKGNAAPHLRKKQREQR